MSSVVSPLSPRVGSAGNLVRFSRLASLLCLVAIVAIPVVVAGQWALRTPAELYAAMVPQAGAHPLPAELAAWQRVVGALLSLTPALCSVVALVHVRRCFDSFAGGRCFEAPVVAGLRGFAGLSALSCGIGLLLQPVLSALLSLGNPAGQRFISVGFGSDQIQSLFFAGTVWIIAAVMAKAVALAQENAGFV